MFALPKAQYTLLKNNISLRVCARSSSHKPLSTDNHHISCNIFTYDCDQKIRQTCQKAPALGYCRPEVLINGSSFTCPKAPFRNKNEQNTHKMLSPLMKDNKIKNAVGTKKSSVLCYFSTL